MGYFTSNQRNALETPEKDHNLFVCDSDKVMVCSEIQFAI